MIKRVIENAKNSTNDNISMSDIKGFNIPLPPLEEQKRIVTKVDELMALCDQLEEQRTNKLKTHHILIKTLLGTLTQAKDANEVQVAWERLSAHFDTLFCTEDSIDQLKQTILQLGIMGRLVKQDPSNEPASVLLEKVAAEKAKLIKEGKIKKQKALPEIIDEEKLFELPSGWGWARLNNVIDVRDGTHDSPKDAIGNNTYPLITSKNFKNGEIDFENARHISEDDHLLISKRSKVDLFDILFSMIGGNLGNQVLVMDNRPFSVKNVALFKYYNKDLSNPYFIKKFTEHLALDLQIRATGGAQPFVSLSFLRKLVIAIPPVQEQERIVAKINELMSICDSLSERLVEAQKLQDLLSKTIVKKAV